MPTLASGRIARLSVTAIHRMSLLAAVLIGVLLAAPPAYAHSALMSSDPADGSTVATLPAAASLTFNEDINGDFSQIVVQSSGDPRPVPSTVKGPTISALLPSDLGGGRIVVRYRVVSKDGHPIAGEIAFTVGAGETSGTAGSGGTSNAARANGPSTGVATSGATPASRSAGTSSVGTGSDNIVAYVLTGFVAVAMLAIGLLLWRWEKQRNRGV